MIRIIQRAPPAAALLLLLLAFPCLVIPAGRGVATATSLPLADRDDWLAWALSQQRALQADRPLDRIQMASTRASFAASRRGYFNESKFLVTGQALFAQHLTLTQQLDLGVRRLDLEAHWVYNRLVACQGGGTGLRTMCAKLASSGFVGGCATAAGVEDQGVHTGCRRTDGDVAAAVAEVAAWSSAHPEELLVIEVTDATEGRQGDVAAEFVSAFGAASILTRSERHGFGTDWPSLSQLRQADKRVVVFSTVPDSTYMLDVVAMPQPPNNLAKKFSGVPVCGYTTGAAVVPAAGAPFGEFFESKQYMNLCQLLSQSPDPAERAQSVMVCGSNFQPEYEHSGAEEIGTFTDDMLAQMLECGLTPSFEQASASQLRKTIWSWAVGTGFSTADKGAVMVATQNGRWMQAKRSTTRPAACRAVDRSRASTELWSIDTSREATFDAAGAVCAAGYEFRAPDGPADNQLLLLSLRRVGTPTVWVGASTKLGAGNAAVSARGRASFAVQLAALAAVVAVVATPRWQA